MAYGKLVSGDILKAHGFSSHEADQLLYRGSYQHLKNFKIQNPALLTLRERGVKEREAGEN